jgi:hypothetical protein
MDLCHGAFSLGLTSGYSIDEYDLATTAGSSGPSCSTPPWVERNHRRFPSLLGVGGFPQVDDAM